MGFLRRHPIASAFFMVVVVHRREDDHDPEKSCPRLLWRHRVENKCSTEANYGRFFPGWSRPTNRRVKRGGDRMDAERRACRKDSSRRAST
jgi:hypothetical protein